MGQAHRIAMIRDGLNLLAPNSGYSAKEGRAFFVGMVNGMMCYGSFKNAIKYIIEQWDKHNQRGQVRLECIPQPWLQEFVGLPALLGDNKILIRGQLPPGETKDRVQLWLDRNDKEHICPWKVTCFRLINFDESQAKCIEVFPFIRPVAGIHRNDCPCMRIGVETVSWYYRYVLLGLEE